MLPKVVVLRDTSPGPTSPGRGELQERWAPGEVGPRRGGLQGRWAPESGSTVGQPTFQSCSGPTPSPAGEGSGGAPLPLPPALARLGFFPMETGFFASKKPEAGFFASKKTSQGSSTGRWDCRTLRFPYDLPCPPACWSKKPSFFAPLVFWFHCWFPTD